MPQHTCVVRLLTFPSCLTGELPKQLPVSLEVLNLGTSRFGNNNKFTGGIPSEWGALTNLKELKMVARGLDGAICMSHHTCVVCLLTFSLFCRRVAQGARGPHQLDLARCLRQFVRRQVVCSIIHRYVLIDYSRLPVQENCRLKLFA